MQCVYVSFCAVCVLHVCVCACVWSRDFWTVGYILKIRELRWDPQCELCFHYPSNCAKPKCPPPRKKLVRETPTFCKNVCSYKVNFPDLSIERYITKVSWKPFFHICPLCGHVSHWLQVKMVCYVWTEEGMDYLLEVIIVKNNYSLQQTNLKKGKERFQALQLLRFTPFIGSTCKWHCTLSKFLKYRFYCLKKYDRNAVTD